jgi:hypothetical protein
MAGEIQNSKFKIPSTQCRCKRNDFFYSAYFESNFETIKSNYFDLKYQPYFLPCLKTSINFNRM